MTVPNVDPRPIYRDALAWALSVIEAVQVQHRTLPTPCSEFDVATLIGHQLAGVRRARIMGEGGDPTTVPLVIDNYGDAASAYSGEASAALRAWEDDEKLSVTVRAPWGTVPGRGAVWAYVNETLVHGWDLAVATGQAFEASPETALPTLEAARTAIPGDSREFMPFGEVVESRADAGPTEQLANWSGRDIAEWARITAPTVG